MAKRQIAILLLLVLLPLATLAWLGWRLAQGEQRVVQQQFRQLLLDRLHDVDNTLATYFQKRERELVELTELTVFEADAIREIVSRHPHVEQMFVLDAEGRLVHPNPADTLSRSERDFLFRTADIFTDRELIRVTTAAGDDAEPPSPHGWHVYYWGPGLHLIFYHRLESGHVVGVLLPRSRWMADLVAELPDTPTDSRIASRNTPDSRIRLVDSNGRTIYQWGVYEPNTEARPFVEAPLRSPLASWRLEYFVAEDSFAAAGSSAYFNLITVLVAIGVVLVTAAAYFYREYAAQVRDAMQRVSFVNQVSHELKTPLTNIRMYADLLQADLGLLDPETARRPSSRLDVIVAESQRLSRLIGNVLTFARHRRNKVSLHKTAGQVDDVIQTVIAHFEPLLEQKGIVVDFHQAADRAVWLDVDALEQILGNLISNVEKYAAEGKQMTVSSRLEGDRATIEIADRGPGIPAGQREAVFRPFHRLSNRIEDVAGAGIGLSIARKLAQLHGGAVVLLQSDTGARFQVELCTPPVNDEEST